MERLKKLLDILNQAIIKPEELKSKANEFFYLYHSTGEDIKPEIIDDILMKLATDIDYFQWDQENREIVNGEEFNPDQKIRDSIVDTLSKINNII